MAIDSVSQSSAAAFNRSYERVEKAANEIATSVVDRESDSNNKPDAVEDIVELKLAQRDVRLSAAVIKAENEAVGTLLDELA